MNQWMELLVDSMKLLFPLHAIQQFNFDLISALPNGRNQSKWMLTADGAAMESINEWINFSLWMKLIGDPAAGAIEGDEMDWGLCWMGGLWALQRQWLRPKKQTNPNQSINSSSMKPNQTQPNEANQIKQFHSTFWMELLVWLSGIEEIKQWRGKEQINEGWVDLWAAQGHCGGN